ncbi:MAG: cytochrome P450, partial [Acidimicrobiales bacterium]
NAETTRGIHGQRARGLVSPMTEESVPIRWDPYSVEIDNDPYPIWKRMRDEQPVYRNDDLDFWALSRFSDVDAASRDTATFSSAHGTVLERMGPERAGGGMMIFLDPPEHTGLRRLVSRAFTPRKVKDLEQRIRTICRDLLLAQVDGPGFDYVTDFAAQVPSRVISSLVGVPPEDQEEQRRNVDGMFHIEPGVGMSNHKSAESALALIEYLSHLMESRTAVPQGDLMSDLVSAELVGDDGTVRRLNADECIEFAILLYTAGTETVAKMLGNAAVLLAEHHDQRKELVANPEMLPNAVEEILRYEPPSPVNGRWTTKPVTLHGVTIPAQSRILLLTGSAGRDERAYVNADAFDVHRTDGQHLSFGYGIHFCIGAALARMEGRIALEETFSLFPEWEVKKDEVVRAHTSTVRGYSSVPVTL